MDKPDTQNIPARGLVTAQIALGFALVAAIDALLAGLGTRWGWWDFRTGFLILTVAAWSGLASAAVSLFAILIGLRGGHRRALVFGNCE